MKLKLLLSLVSDKAYDIVLGAGRRLQPAGPPQACEHEGIQ